MDLQVYRGQCTRVLCFACILTSLDSSKGAPPQVQPIQHSIYNVYIYKGIYRMFIRYTISKFSNYISVFIYALHVLCI